MPYAASLPPSELVSRAEGNHDFTAAPEGLDKGRLEVTILLELGANATEVGIKASRLGEIARAGFRVPRSKILPFSALEPPKRGEPTHLSSELLKDLRLALADLGGGPIVVRSSAEHEDSPFVSSAGLYQTFLGIRSEHELFAAIDACVQSLWSKSALVHAELSGLVAATNRMSIILQEQISPDRAGVLFTLRPSCRASDEMYVEWCLGLGTPIVSGTAAPLCRALSRDIELEDPFGSQLRAMGLSLERKFGRPQDVEWGECDGKLYVFQSRDIVPARSARGIGAPSSSCKAICCGTGVGRLVPGEAEPSSGNEILLFQTPPDRDYDLARVQRSQGVLLVAGGGLSHFASILREFGVPSFIHPPRLDEGLVGLPVVLEAHDRRLRAASQVPGQELKESIFLSAKLFSERNPVAQHLMKHEAVAFDPLLIANLWRTLCELQAPDIRGVETLHPFDEPSRSSYCPASARLQQDGRMCRVQYKRWRAVETVDIREDDEVYQAISHVDEGRAVLASSGLVEFDRQERFVITFPVGKAKFNFYRWPGSSRWYVTAEGPTIEVVRAAISERGYPITAFAAMDGKRIFEALGRHIGDRPVFNASDDLALEPGW